MLSPHMVGRLGVALAVLVIVFAFPLTGGSPVGADTHVVARDAPGVGFQFVPAQLVVDVEGTLMLTNTDLAGHDLVSVADGPEDNPWCDQYPGRACPLFASTIVGLGGQAEVQGIDALPATDPSGAPVTYDYYCSVHPWMTGTITTL